MVRAEQQGAFLFIRVDVDDYFGHPVTCGYLHIERLRCRLAYDVHPVTRLPRRVLCVRERLTTRCRLAQIRLLSRELRFSMLRFIQFFHSMQASFAQHYLVFHVVV